MSGQIVIPARRGKAAFLRRGQTLKVINTHGQQVVDTWAFCHAGPEYHDNCTDNLTAALAEPGLTPPETPSTLNLFMNIPWTGPGDLTFEPPLSAPGCYI